MNKNNPKGSGRKLKYGEPSTTISFKVGVSKKDFAKQVINRWLNKFNK